MQQLSAGSHTGTCPAAAAPPWWLRFPQVRRFSSLLSWKIVLTWCLCSAPRVGRSGELVDNFLPRGGNLLWGREQNPKSYITTKATQEGLSESFIGDLTT